MSTVASAVFNKMLFPHEEKIVTIDQLTYYKLTSVTSLESIISSSLDKQSPTPLTSVSLRVYKYSSLLGAFPSPPPLISKPNSMSVFMLQVSWATLNTLWLPSQPSPLDPPPYVSSMCLSYVSTRNCSSMSQPSRSYSARTLPYRPDTFLIPPSRSSFCHVMASLVLPNMTLGILVWYIDPPASIPLG